MCARSHIFDQFLSSGILCRCLLVKHDKRCCPLEPEKKPFRAITQMANWCLRKCEYSWGFTIQYYIYVHILFPNVLLCLFIVCIIYIIILSFQLSAIIHRFYISISHIMVGVIDDQWGTLWI